MHVMELLGKTRVVVQDGKVVEVGEPQLEWCPLFEKVRHTSKLTKESAKADMENRIRELGMFTPKRRFDIGVFASFGASEVMMSALDCGLIDAAVVVCEGAGSVISNDGKLVQGMCAQMSGLVETEPIPEIIEGITQRGGVVLYPDTAAIDPVGGFKRACQMGYRRIAVTVVDADTASAVRDAERDAEYDIGVEAKAKDKAKAIIIGAHITGMGDENAARFIGLVDITTACASRVMRAQVRSLVQVGTAIPLFAFTQFGKELLIGRAKDVGSAILVNTQKLPSLPSEKQPYPLK